MIKSSRSILVAILLTSGCQEGDPPDPSVGTCIDPDVEKTTLPDLPLARQTEHLDIYSDGFVCAGTSLELERHVTFVADSVGIDLRTHIPVVLSQEPPAQCEGILGTSIAITGCSKPDGAVFSMLTSLYHELNHSAACQLRSGQPRVNALVEGFAVMYEPLHWVSEKNENLTLAELIADETPDYYAAGHFVRWLVEREGPETLADLYRIPSGAEQFPDVLEDLYGLSLEQLEAEYAAAPWKWVPPRQCADLPHAERGPANEWDVMYQSFTFTYDGAEPIYLDYEFDHGIYRVTLERCPVEHVPSSDDLMAFGGDFMIPKINGAQTFPSICPGTWRADVLRVHDANEATPPTDVALWHLTDPPVELLPLLPCE